MNKLCTALFLVGIAAISCAGDLKIKSGNVYKNYVIMGAAPTGIRVIYNNDGGDREVILPVSEFPDELKETVNKYAKDIPAARKAAREQAIQERAEKAARRREVNEAKVRDQKSAAIVQKEKEESRKIQERLKSKARKKNPSFKR